MTLQIGTTARTAACDAIVDLLDVGGTATVQIRNTAASTPADAGAGTLLATVTASATAFGAASSGVATANDFTPDSSADATGNAVQWRFLSGGGTVIMQGTCGTSGADMNFNTVSIVATGTVDITSFTVTVPE